MPNHSDNGSLHFIHILALCFTAITVGVLVGMGVGLAFTKEMHAAPSDFGEQNVTGPTPAELVGAASKGRYLYSMNCAFCHGRQAEGQAEFGAPALAGQHLWYLERQLENFSSGVRGAAEADTHGRQMAQIAKITKDPGLRSAVSLFLTTRKKFHSSDPVTGNPERGKALFSETCAVCHGSGGEGNSTMGAPRISGQAAWYVDRQVNKFKDGIRGAHERDAKGAQMAAIAKQILDDEAINDVASYVQTLPAVLATEKAPRKSETAYVPDKERGRYIYQYNCSACHESTGQGYEKYRAPALGGQYTWYIERQLNNFRTGRRGAHPEDREARQMAPMAKLLQGEDQIKDIASYINDLLPFDVEPIMTGNVAEGKRMFETTCTPCHGTKGVGKTSMNAPRIAGQADWYIEKQLLKFRKNIRGAHEGDPIGQQMAAMAKMIISEEDIANLAAYINSLK